MNGLAYSPPISPADGPNLDCQEVRDEVLMMAGEYEEVLAYFDDGDAGKAIEAIGGVGVLAAILTRWGDDLDDAIQAASDRLRDSMAADDDLRLYAFERAKARGQRDAEEAA